MKTFRFIPCLLVLLGASCARDSGRKDSAATQGSAYKPLSQRMNETNGYKVDANGNWVPRNDRRSSFESQGKSPYFKGDYGKKDYKTGEYSRKSWWGDKDYGRQQYDGNTDGSRFQKSSRHDGLRARETDSAADIPDPYQTGAYATGAAREAGTQGIRKKSDAETDIRRRIFPQPDIIDWREQRSLSVEQSKGILGR